MKKVFYNAKVYVERGCFAEAVLVEDGIVRAVDSELKIRAMAGSDAEYIDCQGKTMIPGLNDSHMHLLFLGNVLNEVKIEGSKSVDDLVERCQKFMVEHPEKVKNGMHACGWNHDLFEEGEKRMPTRHDLDRISTEIPIALERVCGHVLTANTKAIEMLGLTGDSPQYPGGEFQIGEDGYPNGIFAENACAHVNALIPAATYEEKKDIMMEAMRYAVAHGVTSIQSNDVGCSSQDVEGTFKLVNELYGEGKGLLRYHHQVCFKNPRDFENYLKEGEYARVGGSYGEDSWVTLGPLKLFKDGSLGGRTALMTNGYVGAPDVHGIDCLTPEDTAEFCRLAKEYGMQIVTHAIGDEAMRQMIAAYETAFVDGENKLRHAIVHCQITDQEILDAIVEKDILVMAQPIFLNYDMTIVEPLCGKEMASTSYNFGTLLKRGVHLSYGTDCPVEDCNPFPNLYTAVTRKQLCGEPAGGFYPEECVDVETAIDAYTVGSAYNQFEEHRKGRIKEGFLADMILLDRDIFTVDPVEIKDILPVMTVVGGKIVFEK